MRRLILLGCCVFILSGCNHLIQPIQPPIHQDNLNTVPADESQAQPLNQEKPAEELIDNDSVSPTPHGYHAIGLASWYGKKFHGRKTASGERFNMFAMTGAHRSLPFATYVRVTNLKNKKTVIIKINDRGPFSKHRLIDVSYAAAVKLGFTAAGTARVKIEAVTLTEKNKPAL